MKITSFLASLTIGIAGLLTVNIAAAEMDSPTAAAVDAALAGVHRSDGNKARDQYRRPKETLAFFGLRSDMTVVEIWPGGGWYTEILAPVLRDNGKLIAAQYSINPTVPYDGYIRNAVGGFLTKLGANPEIYGKVVASSMDYPNEHVIAPAGTKFQPNFLFPAQENLFSSPPRRFCLNYSIVCLFSLSCDCAT